MAMLMMLPDDVSNLIYKQVFNGCVKEINEYKIDKERNKKIFKNLHEGKLMDWLLDMEKNWVAKKVEKYFEENDPEDMETTDYKEVSNLVFMDTMDYMFDEIKLAIPK
jgi:homoserine trans-succinylase